MQIELASYRGYICWNDNCRQKTVDAFLYTEVKNEQQKLREFDHEEYFITSHFDSVEESLQLFADDELISEPGNCIVTLNLGFPFQIFVLHAVGQNLEQKVCVQG